MVFGSLCQNLLVEEDGLFFGFETFLSREDLDILTWDSSVLQIGMYFNLILNDKRRVN
jgi:hypothetical protein